MAITQQLPDIPATPAPPSNLPHKLPGFLAADDSPVVKLAAEFTRLRQKYDDRAKAHRDIANQAALRAAVAEDDLAHARAVREGRDDPGPQQVNAWRDAEATARRAVAGARDALGLVWRELLSQLAEPSIGDTLATRFEDRRDQARHRLHRAVDEVHAAMRDLDLADDEAAFARQAVKYATAWADKPYAPQRPDGQTERWPSGAPSGNPKPLVIQGRPEPVENVLVQVKSYRAGQ